MGKKKSADITLIAAEARKYLVAQQLEKQGKAEKETCKVNLIEALDSANMESATAEGLKVTKVQPSSMAYDDEGIYNDLKPSQRALCFERSFSMAELSDERRAEVQKAITSLLTPAERKVCIKNKLNVTRLADAVAIGKVDAAVVADHATEKLASPFVRVSTTGNES